MSGHGFARRVTLGNLSIFSPLLGQKRASGTGEKNEPDESANGRGELDPAILEVEKLFAGEALRTGVSFNYGRPGGKGPRARPGAGSRDEALVGEGVEGEELLMRVRPRRDGTQLQISLLVHASSFMNSASHVMAASDGARRPVGFDYTGSGEARKKNLARFEAPELKGMKDPFARFRWVHDEGETELRVLEYEIFDAATSSEGKEVRELLEAGIGSKLNMKMADLGRTETVLSKGVRENAQWYRLNPIS